MANYKIGDWLAGWLAGLLVPSEKMPLRGPSCKLRLARFSARLKFKDGLSVAIFTLMCHIVTLASPNK
jgi:hypothetical protein